MGDSMKYLWILVVLGLSCGCADMEEYCMPGCNAEYHAPAPSCQQIAPSSLSGRIAPIPAAPMQPGHETQEPPVSNF
jgi:hypothetical protein